MATPEDPQGPSGPSEQPASTNSVTSEPEPSPANTATQQPLPGEAAAQLRLPKEVIERLKFTVFGFDTFWVTSVENYQQDGVLFQGNVRGKSPAVAYAKMKERLQAELGAQYDMFLLQDEQDKPTVVVLPAGAGTEQINRFTEVWLAAGFLLGTGLTVASAAQVPVLQWLVDPFRTALTGQDWLEALPYCTATALLLAVHELGHWQAARKHGTQTYLPFIIPAGFGFIGSFGGITRLRSFLPDRSALLELGSQGPWYGAGVSAGVLLLGMVLSRLGYVDIGVESPSFADSLLVALTAQAFLGDQLAQPLVQVNSLVLAGWAGLIINALNCIPTGETDGGRIATALWGRRTASALGIWSAGALALSSLGSALAFYWLILVLVLQRGPVLPCKEELTEPSDPALVRQGVAMLALPFLVLLPYPIELLVALRDQLMNPSTNLIY